MRPALRALTEAPRHYGFHGTLKPPFHLADGCDAGDLRRAMAGFAARQAAFEIAALHAARDRRLPGLGAG